MTIESDKISHYCKCTLQVIQTPAWQVLAEITTSGSSLHFEFTHSRNSILSLKIM